MNMRKSKWFGIGAAVGCSLLAGMPVVGQASTASLTAYVNRTLVDAVNYGNCMAALSVNPNTKLGVCGSTWVSFSCSGTYTSKDIAYRMFDQAQLAVALSKQVMVTIDDTKKHNGYCFASRIDVIR